MSYHPHLNTDKTINRDIPLPYYFQLKELLREEIESGKWQPEQQIPSEAELCERFELSRTVVRQALNELVNEGLLYRQKGKGTFVARPKIGESLVQNLTGFYEDMVARGLTPVTQVLEQSVVPASKKVAEKLNLKPGSKVIKIERRRFINDEPILLVTTYIPYEACPELLNEDLTKQSLYALLEEKYGLEIVRGHRTLEAVAANEYEARLLNIEEKAPLVLLHSVSYLRDGRPIEYYHAVHRGDRSRFEVELLRVKKHGKPTIEEISFTNLPDSNVLRGDSSPTQAKQESDKHSLEVTFADQQ
ncbi:MAG: GntR family transcriptional regulator [Anaerolineae bacterium]